VDLSGQLPLTFGRFTLLSLLGEGGMARVYAAEFTGPAGFRKLAAVKVIRAEAIGGDEGRIAALVNEARVGGLLKHPNIVDTYDFGVVDGHPYVAMERIDGVDVARMLSSVGPPPPALALDLLAAVCAGLHHAHEVSDRGRPLHLVHRDLKPSNVLVGVTGEVKVMDFGLAKATALGIDQTGSGVIKGSPPYMSPEQLRASPLDRRSDLFAVGTLGFELLTGERFFAQETPMSIVGAIVSVDALTAPPSRLDLADERAPGIVAVLRRCLRGDPDERFDNADDVRRAVLEVRRSMTTDDDLADWLADNVAQVLPTSDYEPARSDGETTDGPVGWDRPLSLDPPPSEGEATPSAPSPVLRRGRGTGGGSAIPLAAVGVVLALVVVVALSLLGREDVAPTTTTAEAPSPSSVRSLRVTPSGLPEGQPSLSPSGAFVVFARLEDDLGRLWGMEIDSGRQVRLLPADQQGYEPAVSPDGGRVAFRTDGEAGGIYVAALPPEGLGPMVDRRRLTDFGFHPAWSPDGERLVFSTGEYENSADISYQSVNSDLWTVDLGTGAMAKLLDGATAGDANMPVWSPDGRWIAYWGIDAAGQRNVWVLPAEGGEPRAVTDGPALDWNPRWTDGGRSLLFVSHRSGAGAIWRLPFDPDQGVASGPAVAVTTGGAGMPGFLSPDAAGRRLAFHELSRRWKLNVLRLDAATGEPTSAIRPLTRGERSILDASPSPSGDRVVFWERGDVEDLWLRDLEGDAVLRLTDDPALDRYPTWTPDGAWISFVSTRGGSWGLWLVRPDGTDLRQAAEHIGWSLPRWSPDGLRVAGWDPEAKRPVLVTLGADDLREVSREPILVGLPEGATVNVGGFSPDGRRLLLGFEEPYTWTHSYYIYDLQERRAEPLEQHDLVWFRWLDDGHLLAAGEEGIARVSWPGGEVEILMELPDDGQVTWSGELSADRSTLVMVRGSETVELRLIELTP